MTKSMLSYVKPPNWFWRKSKIGGVQWEHVIKVLRKFDSMSFSGVVGVIDKRWVPPA